MHRSRGELSTQQYGRCNPCSSGHVDWPCKVVESIHVVVGQIGQVGPAVLSHVSLVPLFPRISCLGGQLIGSCPDATPYKSQDQILQTRRIGTYKMKKSQEHSSSYKNTPVNQIVEVGEMWCTIGV